MQKKKANKDIIKSLLIALIIAIMFLIDLVFVRQKLYLNSIKLQGDLGEITVKENQIFIESLNNKSSLNQDIYTMQYLSICVMDNDVYYPKNDKTLYKNKEKFQEFKEAITDIEPINKDNLLVLTYDGKRSKIYNLNLQTKKRKILDIDIDNYIKDMSFNGQKLYLLKNNKVYSLDNKRNVNIIYKGSDNIKIVDIRENNLILIDDTKVKNVNLDDNKIDTIIETTYPIEKIIFKDKKHFYFLNIFGEVYDQDKNLVNNNIITFTFDKHNKLISLDFKTLNTLVKTRLSIFDDLKASLIKVNNEIIVLDSKGNLLKEAKLK